MTKMDKLDSSTGEPWHISNPVVSYLFHGLCSRALATLSRIGAKIPPTIMILRTSNCIVPTDQTDVLDEALTNAGVSHEIFIPFERSRPNDHVIVVLGSLISTSRKAFLKFS